MYLELSDLIMVGNLPELVDKQIWVGQRFHVANQPFHKDRTFVGDVFDDVNADNLLHDVEANCGAQMIAHPSLVFVNIFVRDSLRCPHR